MPRKPRNEIMSQISHIVVKGMNNEYIFEKEIYMKKFKEILKNKLKDSNIKIISYCIMNNHVHLLLYSKLTHNISKYMQRVNTSYSNYYNKINNRTGYVYKNRFYSQPILSEKQLYRCIDYIHNNPIKAKICENQKKYKYSSAYEIWKNESNGLISKNTKVVIYKKLHKKCKYEKGTDEFIDIKDMSKEDFFKEIKKEYNISNIHKNKELLKQIIKEARKKTDVSIIELASFLQISKSTVSNYKK